MNIAAAAQHECAADLDGAHDASASADASFHAPPRAGLRHPPDGGLPAHVLLASDSGGGVCRGPLGLARPGRGGDRGDGAGTRVATAVAPRMARSGHWRPPIRDRRRSPRGAAARRPASRRGIRAERARPVHGRHRRPRAPQARGGSGILRGIYGGDACTYTAPEDYFSYRRDGRTGRQATLIWLEK